MAKNKKSKSDKKPSKKKATDLIKDSKLNWLPKKTFEIEFSIPWEKITDAYQQTLKQKAKEVEIKGFRKGKAPLKTVEQNIDKTKVYRQAINNLLPIAYNQLVDKHKLKPVCPPQIKPEKVEEGKDWEFKAKACESPQVKLDNYEDEVKGALAKTKIWTPGSSNGLKKGKINIDKDEEKKDKKVSYDEKLKIITETLLKTTEAEISELLLEQEKNRMLSNLLDQVNSMGMNVKDYLSSKGISDEQLQEQYRKQAENNLKLEFILAEIIKDQGIEIDKKEVDKMVSAAEDEKQRKKMDTPLQRAYIKQVLAKRKALDYLMNL